MKFDKEVLADFSAARSLEWLETNGLGGFASGTASGAHSRRYHGLLVAALHPPVGRTVLLSKLDETIITGEKEKESQPVRYELGTNQFPGAIHPTGFLYLEQFERNLFPVFTYNAGGAKLKKTIAAVHGQNTTLVLYELIEASSPITLELLPLASSRDYHNLSHVNDSIGRPYLFDKGIFRTLNYHGGAELFISVPGSRFTEQQGWYYNFEYSVEQNRGLDFQEDLYTHGKFSVKMKKGDTLGVIISTEDPAGKNAFRIFSAEQKRREKIVGGIGANTNMQHLALAADQFIVARGSLNTVIAGYHWFADWGRDTMISLPGLCLATGRFKDAKQILQQFASCVSEGMLPNRFPDQGEQPEYNTIDATLWFFYAIHAYYKYTGDKAFIKTILPVLEDIIAWHYKGTRYNIKVDPIDGLLSGGQDGVQLTWMDAKVGDWVVTPRRGKVVEINALWYNALRSMSALYRELGKEKEAQRHTDEGDRVYASFNSTFWSDENGYLFDHIDGDHRNDDLRPNQLYALSLPYRLLAGSRARAVLEAVRSNLLTPKGLRSLAAKHRDYRSRYEGDRWSRDGGYHQGTVWSFLIGSYIDALFYVDEGNARNNAVQIVNTFLTHLSEAGVGTVSEIFDADPPHTPRGCIAQAWGVAEVLRVVVEHRLIALPSFKAPEADICYSLIADELFYRMVYLQFHIFLNPISQRFAQELTKFHRENSIVF